MSCCAAAVNCSNRRQADLEDKRYQSPPRLLCGYITDVLAEKPFIPLTASTTGRTRDVRHGRREKASACRGSR